MTFKCVQCPKTFLLERPWVDHLKHEHGLAPMLLDPILTDPSQVTELGPNLSMPSTPPTDNIAPAPHQGLGPKVSFHVAYDFSQGDEVSPIRTTIPKDESYENFLRRLRHVFYGDSFERSLRQWEYVLVNRQYKKGDPLLLTSSNTYYAMVSELLRPRSPWRYAVIRRSHSENPIIRAIAEGTFHLMPDPSVLDIPAPDTFLPDYPPTLDATQPDISTVDIPPAADPSQSDDSVADVSMPAAPKDQAAPELIVSTHPSKAWVMNTPSAEPLGQTPSPGPPSKAKTQELSTPTSAKRQGPSVIHSSTPPPAANFNRPPIEESSTSVIAASLRSAYVQVQSGLTTLPTASEQPLSATNSSIQAQPTKPTPIFRPRRPLRIISRRHVNSGVEYQVHWNSGRNSWESHDSLYRDYPALIDKLSEGER